MTLRCVDCGGAVALVDSEYDRDADGEITGEGRARETYECVECDASGTYEFGGGGPEVKTGCLTSSVLDTVVS